MKVMQNEGSRDIRGAIEVTKGSIAAEVYLFADELWEVLAPRYLSYRCVYAIWLVNRCQHFFPQNLACTLVQALHRNFFCVKILNIVFNFYKLHSAELSWFVLLFLCVRNTRSFPGFIWMKNYLMEDLLTWHVKLKSGDSAVLFCLNCYRLKPDLGTSCPVQMFL